MDPYGPLWTPMDPYGPLWTPMDPYGPIWTPMDPYGPSGCFQVVRVHSGRLLVCSTDKPQHHGSKTANQEPGTIASKVSNLTVVYWVVRVRSASSLITCSGGCLLGRSFSIGKFVDHLFRRLLTGSFGFDQQYVACCSSSFS